MNRANSSLVTVLMLIIFLGMLFVAWGYPDHARFMPFVIGIPAVGLLILQLFLDARARALPQTTPATPPEALPDPEPELPPRVMLRREIIVWSFFLGYAACILLFGFYIAIPIMLLTFLHYQGEQSWTRSLLMAAAGTIVTYIVFHLILKVPLHTGFVTQILLASIEDIEWLQPIVQML